MKPLLTLALGALLAGCATAPTDRQLTTIQIVASEAAYVGGALRLDQEPASRAQFGVVVSALEVMVRQGNYTPGALQAALAQLPVLHGSSGAILESGAVLYIVAAGFVDLDSAPRVKAAVTGLLAGLERALARPTGPATRALAPPLPDVCAIPARGV